MSRRMLVLASLAVAAAGAAAAAALVLGSGGSKQVVSPPGAARIQTLLRGIPQHGTALGSAAAPVTLVEFADPQCPYCGVWAKNALPAILDRYVRPGKIRIVFSGMAFLGPDSTKALRTALAASRENRFWNVMELLFENQGAENSGWVTDSLLRSIGDAAGLDSGRMLAASSSAAVDREIARADAFARNAGVNSTPSFGLGPTGGAMRLVQPTSLDASGLTPALDAALGR